MARKLIEQKIGERFDYNGVTLEVVEQVVDDCEGCYLWLKQDCHYLCSYLTRSDCKSVIFKEVKK